MTIKKSFLILMLILAFSGITNASIFIGTDNKNFRPQAVYDDDIFLGGNKIRFQSEITGDLIGGSQELDFSGTSAGNINWAARWIIIKGPVENSVRIFAQKIDINAPIGRNLIAFGQSISIGPATRITRDAIIRGETVEFEGYVGKELNIKGDQITIAGTIAGNLDIEAQQLEIKPNTVIEGDLIYESPEKVKIEDSVIINGEIRRIESKIDNKTEKYRAFSPITFMLGMFLVFNFICSLFIFVTSLFLGNGLLIPCIIIALIVCGVIIVNLNRKIAIRAVRIIEKRLLVAFGLGLLLILLFPLAAFLTTATVIGMPLGLMIVFAFGIMTFAGAIYAAQFVGCNIGRLLNLGKKPLSNPTLIIGIVLLSLILLIPVVNWILTILILATGLGALVLSLGIFKEKDHKSLTESNTTDK
ncbi:MAG: polymer-forming cytoskeletal protein [candidate division Zixibacteria bacterium]|nr:polymer-forming cytoskeletal protein [candidate division Zixibacteria bacterium]